MLRTRGFACAVCCFCIGVYVGMNTEGVMLALIFALSGVLCVVFAAAHRFLSAPTGKAALYILCGIVGAFWLCAYGTVVFGSASDYNGVTDTVTGEVIEVKKYVGDTGITVSVKDSTAGIKAGTRVKLWCGTTENISEGNVISADVKYYVNRNDSLKADFVLISGEGTLNSVEDGTNPLYYLRNAVKDTVDRMYETFPDDIDDVARAVIGVGQDEIDTQVYALYRNGGVSHLLVVSGLHVSLIIMSISAVLKLFGVGTRVRGLISMVSVILFSMFIGFTPSVTRAAIMLCILSVSAILFRHYDGITSLAAALMLTAAVNPFTLASLSTQLSYASCFAIMAVTTPLGNSLNRLKTHRKRHVAKLLVTPIALSFAATVATFPIMIADFGVFSWIAPVVNLIITPFFSYLIILEIISLVIFAIIGSGGAVIGFLSANAYGAVNGILKLIYNGGIGSLSTNLPFIWTALLCSLAAIGFVLLASGKARVKGSAYSAVAAVLCVAVCAAGFYAYNSNRTELLVSDGSQEYSVLALRNGKSVYVDIDGKGYSPAAVVNNGYCGIDRYVMTSVNERSVAKLLNSASMIYISEIIIPQSDTENPDNDLLCEYIYKTARGCGCAVTKYGDICDIESPGMSVSLCDGSVDIRFAGKDISVLYDDGAEKNADTLVVTSGAKADADAVFIAERVISTHVLPENTAFSGSISTFEDFDGVRIELFPKDGVTGIEY